MLDLDNIVQAIHSAAKGKRHKTSVKKALGSDDGLTYAYHVRHILSSGLWNPPKVRKGFYVEDGVIRKRRLIVHPDFFDLVVQHLLVDFVLEPIFSPTFYRWSCGSIPGRGQESMSEYIMRKVRGPRSAPGKALRAAIERGERTLYIPKHPPRSKVRYHEVDDIRKCFGTIEIVPIYEELKRKIRDRWVLDIAWKVLDSNTIELPHGPGETPVLVKAGVPIGMYTSPWFVNIALSRVDHWVKDECGMYVFTRFIDDTLMLDANKREIQRAAEGMEAVLAHFGLRLKARPVVLDFLKPSGRKVRYTGFQFTLDRIVVRDKVFIRAKRKGARLLRKMRNKGRRNRVTAHDASAMISYGGRFKAFEQRHAFTREVLREGRIRFRTLRRKVSQRDLKAQALHTNTKGGPK